MLHLLDRVVGLARPRNPKEEEDSERRAGPQRGPYSKKESERETPLETRTLDCGRQGMGNRAYNTHGGISLIEVLPAPQGHTKTHSW